MKLLEYLHSKLNEMDFHFLGNISKELEAFFDKPLSLSCSNDITALIYGNNVRLNLHDRKFKELQQGKNDNFITDEEYKILRQLEIIREQNSLLKDVRILAENWEMLYLKPDKEEEYKLQLSAMIEKSNVEVNKEGYLTRAPVIDIANENLKKVVVEISEELKTYRTKDIHNHDIIGKAVYLVDEKIFKVFIDKKKPTQKRTKYLGMTRITFLKSFFSYLGLNEIGVEQFYKKF